MVEVEEMFALTSRSLGKTVEGDPTQEGLSRGGSSSLPLSGRLSRGRNNVLPHMVFNPISPGGEIIDYSIMVHDKVSKVLDFS